MNAILALVAALVIVAGWSAMHRATDVDQSLASDSDGGKVHWPDMRVNVNRAGVAELALLPGLGERLAQRIVDDRDARGPFQSLNDLERVPGMGAATIERLAPYAIATP